VFAQEHIIGIIDPASPTGQVRTTIGALAPMSGTLD
jgi:hypothetical protein